MVFTKNNRNGEVNLGLQLKSLRAFKTISF